jgi:phage tail-like protein
MADPTSFDDYPFTAFRFEVLLLVAQPDQVGLGSPLCAGQFSDCDGLEMTMEPKTVKEGGNNLEQIHLPGRVSYGQLTLKRGMTANLDLWKWFTVAAGGGFKANQQATENKRGLLAVGQVTMFDNGGRPKLRFMLTGCLPVKIKGATLSAKDGQVAIEEMQIAYRTLAVKNA